MTSETAGAAAPKQGKATGIASIVASTTPWPSSRTAYYTVLLLILSLTSLQLDTAIVPYVSGAIKADLHISDTNLGLLLGLSFGLFYTLVGIPIAWLIDRFSRKWIIAIGIATWSLGTALCGVAQNYGQLFFARFVVGAGEAGNGPASYSVVADLFPREKMPRAIAYMQLGSVIGPGLALAVAAYLLNRFLEMKPMAMPWGTLHGWQLILIAVGLPGVLVSLLMIFTMPDPARRTIASQVTGPGYASGPFAAVTDYWVALVYMAKHWRVFGPMFASLFFGALSIGSIQWTPIFYIRTFHWKPGLLAILSSGVQLTLLPVCMVLGVLIAERFAKKGRSDAAMRTYLIGSSLGLLGIFWPLMPNPWLAFALGSLRFVAIGIGSPSQNAAMQIVCPAEMRGKITSLYLFLFSVVGVALAPIVTGLITDYVFHDDSMIRWSIFLPSVILSPLSLLMIWLGQKPYGREVERLKALEAAA